MRTTTVLMTIIAVTLPACAPTSGRRAATAQDPSSVAVPTYTIPAGVDPERPWETTHSSPVCRNTATLDAAVLFDVGSAVLSTAATGVLRQLTGTLCASIAEPLVIVGHTDSDGTTEANLELSLQRANGVADWLRAHGFGAIEARGAGEDEPIATNATPEGRAANRRVVVSTRTKATA